VNTTDQPSQRTGARPTIVLVHGWPYDIHSFADVTPVLAAAGYRILVPFVRGYGTTRFLSDGTPRNGQQGAVAADVIAFMDVLGIERAILAGFDWGGGRPTSRRTAIRRCGGAARRRPGHRGAGHHLGGRRQRRAARGRQRLRQAVIDVDGF
jgi:pimeloyl-ACP methyl ester carboxylesterase